MIIDLEEGNEEGMLDLGHEEEGGLQHLPHLVQHAGEPGDVLPPSDFIDVMITASNMTTGIQDLADMMDQEGFHHHAILLTDETVWADVTLSHLSDHEAGEGETNGIHVIRTGQGIWLGGVVCELRVSRLLFFIHVFFFISLFVTVTGCQVQ